MATLSYTPGLQLSLEVAPDGILEEIAPWRNAADFAPWRHRVRYIAHTELTSCVSCGADEALSVEEAEQLLAKTFAAHPMANDEFRCASSDRHGLGLQWRI